MSQIGTTPSRSTAEPCVIYGTKNGVPEIIDMIDAGSLPSTEEGLSLLLQYASARANAETVFISRGKSLLGVE